MQNKKQKFDSEGSGYDYESAKKYGIKPNKSGKWQSRVPETGLLLKGAKRIEMAEYGKYHQLGTSRNKYAPHPKREFLSLSVDNADKASAEMVRRMVRAFKSKIRK